MNKWRFEYGSDLHWLWGWGRRIQCRLDSEKHLSDLEFMIFRPDNLASGAMTRLGIEYPLAIKPVTDWLTHSENQYRLFCDNPSEASEENLWHSMDALAERIRTTCDAIAASQLKAERGENVAVDSANSANNARLFPGGFPDNVDVRDLVCKLDAGKGSGKSDNEIAREFTRETKESCNKAKSLLSQIRRLKREGKVSL